MKRSLTAHASGNELAGLIFAVVMLACIAFSGGNSLQYLANMCFGRDFWFQQMQSEESRRKTLKALENHPDRERFIQANPYLKNH